MLKAAAQNLHQAIIGDLAQQAVQELGTLVAFLADTKSIVNFGLGNGEALQQIDQINGIFPVKIMRVPTSYPVSYTREATMMDSRPSSLVSAGFMRSLAANVD
ncbi:MAG: hypothetical protein OXE78_11740 [Gammaproteobacteria bacterium]|nr:hypothetical protein [Gammaproteobacteria bacterium]MCY4357107.1 hypothetical protein [Gammaproteobacteria bacterium]